MALSLYDLGQGASTELSTRASADIVLSTNVSTEVSIRTAQSTTTSTNISTTSRLAGTNTNGLMASGDYTKLSGLGAGTTYATSTQLSTELSTRASADTVLSTNISTEVSIRTSADMMAGVLTAVKTDLDATYNIYRLITYNRPGGGTLYMTSQLSLNGGTAPNYLRRVETYYDINGQNGIAKTYTIHYDANGIIDSETCA